MDQQLTVIYKSMTRQARRPSAQVDTIQSQPPDQVHGATRGAMRAPRALLQRGYHHIRLSQWAPPCYGFRGVRNGGAMAKRGNAAGWVGVAKMGVAIYKAAKMSSAIRGCERASATPICQNRRRYNRLSHPGTNQGWLGPEVPEDAVRKDILGSYHRTNGAYLL